MRYRRKSSAFTLVETVIAVFEKGRTRKWKLHRPKAAVTRTMIQQALAAPAQA